MAKSTEEFMACGKAHASERDAIVAMIDMFRVAEAGGGALFSGWAKVCKTPMLRGGLAMVAEREYYHARMFEKRMDELGVERKAAMDSPEGRDMGAYFADPAITDLAKVRRFNELVGDPKQTFSELKTLMDRISDDVETGEMLRLFYHDEMSSTGWMREMEGKLAEAPARAA